MARFGGLAFIVVGLGCGPGVASDTDTARGDASGGATTATEGPAVSGTSSADTTTGVGTTTGGSTTVSVDESTGWLDTGESFIADPDGGGHACYATSYCDPWAQNCGDAEKCVAWSADGDHELDGCVLTRCSPLAPDPVPTGGTCTSKSARGAASTTVISARTAGTPTP